MEIHKGNCHICGRYTELTYEHIPPKAALNHRPVKVFSGLEIIEQQQEKIIPDTFGLKYQNRQQGAGKYTLCQKCNNNTGAYYAKHYVHFSNSLFDYLSTEHSNYKNQESKIGDKYPKLKFVTKNINHLAFFKQIIAMFCSTSRFNTYNDDFREFLLNKDSTSFNQNRWMVSIYINTGTRCGTAGLTTTVLKDNKFLRTAEIVTVPLGIILYDLEASDMIKSHLFGCGITALSQIPYNSDQQIAFELPYNKGAKFIPGFYEMK